MSIVVRKIMELSPEKKLKLTITVAVAVAIALSALIGFGPSKSTIIGIEIPGEMTPL